MRRKWRATALCVSSVMIVPLALSAAEVPNDEIATRDSFLVSRAPLGEAIKKVGETSGLRCSINSKQLANRPIVLFAPNRTPKEVMQGLAKFIAATPGGCQLVQRADGELSLEELPSNRDARISMTARQRAQRSRQLVIDIKRALSFGLLGDEALTSRRTSHPELVNAIPVLRPGLAVLASLNAEQRAALVDGKSLSLKIKDLDPQVQQYAASLTGGLRRQRRSVPPEFGGGWLEWRADRDLPNTSVSIRLAGKPDRPGITVALAILPGSRNGFPDLLHPPAPPKGERAPWLGDILSKREAKEEKLRQEFIKKVRIDPDLARKISISALLELPPSKARITGEKRYSDLADALSQIADKSGLSVIGDYDPCWDDYYTRLDAHEPDMRSKTLLRTDIKDVPVWEAMEILSEYFEVKWEKHRQTLFVKSPRVAYALMDGIDLLDPPPLPNFWQRHFSGYKPGDRVPGVAYGD